MKGEREGGKGRGSKRKWRGTGMEAQVVGRGRHGCSDGNQESVSTYERCEEMCDEDEQKMVGSEGDGGSGDVEKGCKIPYSVHTCST